MKNPYNLTDEQMQAYSVQIEEERRERALMPKGEAIKGFRELLRQDTIQAHRIKFGLGPVLKESAGDA